MFERKPYYTPKELGAIVGVSHDKILDMIHAGSLFAVKLGPKTYRVPLGAALRVFAPDEIAPGREITLPAGTSEQVLAELVAEGVGDHELTPA